MVDMSQRFGLAWNPNKKGHILGASEDKTVCHWQGILSCARLVSCTDDLRSQGLECLFKGKLDDRASHCI
jgi:hypothetical protein